MTAIDWSLKPWPWNEIGPRFAEEVEAIKRGEAAVDDHTKRRLRLRDQRRILQISQIELGRRTGVPPATLSQMETGVIGPGGAAWGVVETYLSQALQEAEQTQPHPSRR